MKNYAELTAYLEAIVDDDFAALSDSELLNSYKGGRDPRAFKAIVARFGPQLYRYCRSRFVQNEGEEVFQAAIVLLYVKIDKVDALPNWLYGTVRRVQMGKICDHKRFVQRLKILQQINCSPEDDENICTRIANEDDLVRDRVALLYSALDQIQEKYRQPIILHKIERLPLKVVANRLEMPLGTVASRCRKGMAVLRSRLEKLGFVPSVAALDALFAGEAASASVPPKLVSTTLIAVMDYAAGGTIASPAVAGIVAQVSRAMLVTTVRTKVATVLYYALCVAVGPLSTLRASDVPTSESSLLQSEVRRPALTRPADHLAVTVQVIKVIDCTTLEIEVERVRFIVQLAGVASPKQAGEPRPDVELLGSRSHAFTRSLIEGAVVHIYIARSPPGPVCPRRVYVFRATDNLFVNQTILRQGFGTTDSRVPFVVEAEFREAVRQARAQSLGLWADHQP